MVVCEYLLDCSQFMDFSEWKFISLMLTNKPPLTEDK